MMGVLVVGQLLGQLLACRHVAAKTLHTRYSTPPCPLLPPPHPLCLPFSRARLSADSCTATTHHVRSTRVDAYHVILDADKTISVLDRRGLP